MNIITSSIEHCLAGYGACLPREKFRQLHNTGLFKLIFLGMHVRKKAKLKLQIFG